MQDYGPALKKHLTHYLTDNNEFALTDLFNIVSEMTFIFTQPLEYVSDKEDIQSKVLECVWKAIDTGKMDLNKNISGYIYTTIRNTTYNQAIKENRYENKLRHYLHNTGEFDYEEFNYQAEIRSNY